MVQPAERHQLRRAVAVPGENGEVGHLKRGTEAQQQGMGTEFTFAGLDLLQPVRATPAEVSEGGTSHAARLPQNPDPLAGAELVRQIHACPLWVA